MKKRYAYFDGDNIGNAIDNLLNGGRTGEATHLSERITRAVFEIGRVVRSSRDIELIIAGGDDVLIAYDADRYDPSFLEEITQVFTRHTGLSMSCGVGDNVGQAIANLMTAKQMKKGTIEIPNVDAVETQQLHDKNAKLWIFATSDLPDPYINVMAHCVARHRITEVTLIGVAYDRGKVESQRHRLGTLRDKISEQLDMLSQSQYMLRTQSGERQVTIDMEPPDRQRYTDLKRIRPGVHVAVYEDLDQEISRLMGSSDGCVHLFDVTAALKSHLVDIYTILRFRNVSTIYSFELGTEQRTYDHRELIHNLTHGKTYEYVCLAESLHTRNRMVISQESVIAESKLGELLSAFDVLRKTHDQLKDTIATRFAKFGVLTYFSFASLGFVWLCWVIAQPGGWNRVEPLTYIVGLGWFLLSYLLQVPFTGKVPSLSPRGLFRVLKTWRRRRLELTTEVIGDRWRGTA